MENTFPCDFQHQVFKPKLPQKMKAAEKHKKKELMVLRQPSVSSQTKQKDMSDMSWSSLFNSFSSALVSDNKLKSFQEQPPRSTELKRR